MPDLRQGTCPECHHHEVVQAPQKLFAASVWAEQKPPAHDMNIFFCRRCGFAQSYVIEPEKVPISEMLGTRLVKGPETGPYR